MNDDSWQSTALLDYEPHIIECLCEHLFGQMAWKCFAFGWMFDTTEKQGDIISSKKWVKVCGVHFSSVSTFLVP